MKTNMILSASGWRKVFAIGGQEQDKTSMIGEDNIAISIYAAKVFADYVKNRQVKKNLKSWLEWMPGQQDLRLQRLQ